MLPSVFEEGAFSLLSRDGWESWGTFAVHHYSSVVKHTHSRSMCLKHHFKKTRKLCGVDKSHTMES